MSYFTQTNMRKSRNPFEYRPSRLGHQDRYNASLHRKRTWEATSRSSSNNNTTRRKSSSTATSSYNYSGETNSGCMITVGVLILLFVVVLTICSFSWEWASYSYPLNHKTDWSWLKIIFYPAMILGAVFGIFWIKSSLPQNKD